MLNIPWMANLIVANPFIAKARWLFHLFYNLLHIPILRSLVKKRTTPGNHMAWPV